jgi:hypothetical protein
LHYLQNYSPLLFDSAEEYRIKMHKRFPIQNWFIGSGYGMKGCNFKPKGTQKLEVAQMHFLETTGESERERE